MKTSACYILVETTVLNLKKNTSFDVINSDASFVVKNFTPSDLENRVRAFA